MWAQDPEKSARTLDSLMFHYARSNFCSNSETESKCERYDHVHLKKKTEGRRGQNLVPGSKEDRAGAHHFTAWM